MMVDLKAISTIALKDLNDRSTLDLAQKGNKQINLVKWSIENNIKT